MRQPAAYDEYADWAGASPLITIDDRYAVRSHSFDGPSAGVRARVGAWHVPLADVLNAVTAASLRLVRTLESGPGGIPDVFGLVAERR